MSITVSAQITLTETEALSRLSPESPRIRAIRSAVDLGRADVLAAGRWPNPRVTFDRETVNGITEDITSVLQPLPLTGRRGLDVQAASAALAAVTSRVDDAMRRTRADLRLAFSNLLAAQARERVFTEARDHLQELADILAKREAAGDAAGFDRLRAEREALDLDADRANAAIDRARAQAALAGFFGEPIDPSTVRGVDSNRVTASIPDVDGLMERAETVRGELLALRRDAEAAQFAVRAAERRLVPEPEIIGGRKSSSVPNSSSGGVFAVQVAVPLFDRAHPERALAQAKVAQATARASAFRIALRAELASLRTAVLERRSLADRYRSGAVSGVDRVERIAQVSYDAGERTILELLDAYRVSATARVRQVVLDAAVRESEIELEFASGWETLP
jgi:cobalt-zinc-cadmium efflux system outer membrane protein